MGSWFSLVYWPGQRSHYRTQSVMLNFSPAILPGLLLLSQVEAWGGVFNRYNPSLHSSYVDTSGNYYNLMTDSKHHVEEPRMVEKQIAELLEEEAAAEADPCHQRKCTSNEHCCDGMVCVDTSNGHWKLPACLRQEVRGE